MLKFLLTTDTNAFAIGDMLSQDTIGRDLPLELFITNTFDFKTLQTNYV